MKRIAALIILGISTCLVHAQTKILYNSSHAKAGSPIPQECLAAGAALMHGLVSYPHPAKWTYIISCDDFAWSDTMMAARNDRGKLIYGATNPENFTTLLRGSTLRDDGDRRVTAEHLIAHELAHIFLQSNDDAKVEKLAQSWLIERHASVLVAAN
ncbi:hypothetical protein [Granulicella sp. dw_53]|uniref:hypothetical protein n=1 Tax=Granulicella sp. dw_53 TaxID=2719792 RepID=UPI001BD1F8A4|nr:hypothetical protein [Granulicella sp. dw_53]